MQSCLTSDQMIAMLNFGYWVLLKLVTLPIVTIYLLAYYGDHAKDIGGTYAVIVIAATVLFVCDLTVAERMFTHYK